MDTTRIDIPWAVAKVKAFVETLRQLRSAPSPQSNEFVRGWRQQLEELVHTQLMTVIKIARETEPGLVEGLSKIDGGAYVFPHSTQLRSAEILLGALGDAKEVAEHLSPQGPRLAAADMHPWVWEEAAPRWDAGFYRDAVQAAATRVFDTELPKKLGVQPTKDPADLFAAFAPDRPATKPTLRFQDVDPFEPSWENVHRGAMLVGQGCVKAIRNQRTHRLEVREDQVALEELATLSLLARWIDDAELTPAVT